MFAWFSRSNYSQSSVGDRPLHFDSTTLWIHQKMRLNVFVTKVLIPCLWRMMLLSNRQFTEHRMTSFVRSRLYFRDEVGHRTGPATIARPQPAHPSNSTGARTRFWWTRRHKRHENILIITWDIHYLLLLFFEVRNREFESARMKSKLFAVLDAVTTS